jgi:hypothetical protein
MLAKVDSAGRSVALGMSSSLAKIPPPELRDPALEQWQQARKEETQRPELA